MKEDSITDSTANRLRRGLALNHPRFGLGMVESVSFRGVLRLRYGEETSIAMVHDQKPEDVIEEIKNRTPQRQPSDWELRAYPTTTVTVRFLSSLRSFSLQQLLAKAGEDQGPKFYTVEQPEALAALL